MSGSLIPCLTWVRRGKAKSQPEKVQISKDDIQKAIEQTQDNEVVPDIGFRQCYQKYTNSKRIECGAKRRDAGRLRSFEDQQGKGTTHNTNGKIILRDTGQQLEPSTSMCRDRKRTIEAPAEPAMHYQGQRLRGPIQFQGENLDLSRCPEVHTESIVRDRVYFLAKYCQTDDYFQDGQAGIKFSTRIHIPLTIRLEEEEEAEEIEDDDNVDTENVTAENTVKKESDIEAALNAAMAVKTSSKKKKKKKDGKKSEIEEQVDKDVAFINDVDAKYKMDDYDREESSSLANPLAGIANLTVYADNNEDPYITLKDGMDSDDEDFVIKDTDNLIVVGRATEDFCTIEKHVYNSDLVNLFVQDDFLLASFPLAVEWLDFDITDDKPGNFVAVGTMEPTIDIWDLDLIGSLEPIATLGERLKKKKKSEGKGHRDAVLALSWNQNARHVLASASADKTVLLWDLTEGQVAMTLKSHTDKVQCVKWHPFEEHMLLSGSFDKTVKLFDCRTMDGTHKSWSMEGEIEKVVWNQHAPLNYLASTDSGHIYYMDTRQDKPLYTLSAHNEAITGVALSSDIPNLLVTASTDDTVKIWDISDNRPSIVLSSNAGIGGIHSMQNCPDEPFVFAFGGTTEVKVWDIRENSDVFSHFCSGEHIKSENTKDVAMETEDGDDENTNMESESLNNTTSQTNKKKKKKKKKKNKNQN